jgi:argininosuccinate lyase
VSTPSRFTDARLGDAPAEKLQEYMTRPWLERERERLPYYNRVDLAYAAMLTEERILTRAQGAALVTALEELEQAGPDRFAVNPELNSLLFQIEAWLAEKLGEDTAGRLHTGRGRADYGAAILTLYARDALLATAAAITAFEDVLLDLAEAHAGTVMPGYTHLQQSQPTTFGHYLLGQFFPFDRDFDRFRGSYGRGNLCPLGSPARSGTSWPINRERLAALLGFDGVTLSTQDLPYYRRDHMADLAASYALLMSNLGRLATDLDQWNAQEFGFVEIADAYAGSSSIMPQKKNPYPLELIRGLAGESIGWVPAMLGVLKAAHTSAADPEFTPLHNGTLIQQACTQAVHMLDLFADVLRTLHVYPDVMLAHVRRGWSAASHLADVLAREGDLPFRTAHRVVARLVRLASQQGAAPADVDAALLRQAAGQVGVAPPDLDTAAVRRALDPEEFVRTRVTAGSQRPDEVRRVLGMCRESLADQRAWVEGRRRAVAGSEEQLRRAVAAIKAAG